MRKHAGFTLLELLLVIFIIGVATALAVPNFIAGSDDDSARDELGKLSAVLDVASETAIISNQVIGLRFNSEGYELRSATALVDQLVAEANADDNGNTPPSPWAAGSEGLNKPRAFAQPLLLELEVDGRPVEIISRADEDPEEPWLPHVLVEPTGLYSLFNLTAAIDDRAQAWQLGWGEDARLRVKAAK